MLSTLHNNKISWTIENSRALTLVSYSFTQTEQVFMDEILYQFLQMLKMEKYHSQLSYCIRELAVNAKKANTKRIFFKLNKLNILDYGDYNKGMERFKDETLSNINFFLDKQKQEGLYIKIQLHADEEKFTIIIRNNSIMTPWEEVRVRDKLKKAAAYSTVPEALTSILDTTEGAGLGLILLTLMLKSLGLSRRAFSISTHGVETVARMVLPVENEKRHYIKLLSAELTSYIDSLPPFPEHVQKLRELFQEEFPDENLILDIISKDPFLAGTIIRMANSSMYRAPRPIENLKDAVALIGIKSLGNIALSLEIQNYMGKHTADGNSFWRHSYKVGFFAKYLGKKFHSWDSEGEKLFAAGIIHDMGKIPFNVVHPELVAKIKKFCLERSIPEYILENLMNGINHAEIGGLLAKKWNFPPYLVDMIQYHHWPNAASRPYRDSVFVLALANDLVSLEEGSLKYEQLDPVYMQEFQLYSEQDARTLIQECLKAMGSKLLEIMV